MLNSFQKQTTQVSCTDDEAKSSSTRVQVEETVYHTLDKINKALDAINAKLDAKAAESPLKG